MWKIIDTEIIDKLQPGDIITSNPGSSNAQYEIKTITSELIRAIHYNGILAFKVLPKYGLISGSWWVKK